MMTDRPLLDWVRRSPPDDAVDHVGVHRLARARRGRRAEGRRRHHALGRAWTTCAELGANPVQERVVERGKIVTAAGVSAGIDMALTLAARIAGDEVAQAIQLGIEYDPQPPFDAGNAAKASPDLVQAVLGLMTARAEAPAS